jgi:hypothetical protein
MLRRRPLVLAAALVVLAALARAVPALAQPPEASPDLSGTWQLAGWNMGVDPAQEPSYRGTVTLEAKGHDTYAITWTIGERQNRGVGLYDPRTGVFAGGYAIGQQPGVAVWNRSADGKRMDCVGTFQARLGEVAHESWTRE